MYAALVNAWGEAPKYTKVAELPPPGADEVRIKVEAVGVHHVVRSRARGTHYSSGKPPHVPGIDGIGTTDDGQKVYFLSFGAGTMAEYINMPKSAVFPAPANIDPVQTAGVMNPAMSSWMAFKTRTANVPSDFTVLIVGATSASGRVAIPLARALGAKKVIGAARNKATLETLWLDQTVVLEQDVEKTDYSGVGDVDVVLDYVFGPVATHLLNSIKTPKPLQYVHIGALATMDITLPGAALRSKDITIRGSGPGAWSPQQSAAAFPSLLEQMPTLPPQPVKAVALKDVEKEWAYQGGERLVVVL